MLTAHVPPPDTIGRRAGGFRPWLLGAITAHPHGLIAACGGRDSTTSVEGPKGAVQLPKIVRLTGRPDDAFPTPSL